MDRAPIEVTIRINPTGAMTRTREAVKSAYRVAIAAAGRIARSRTTAALLIAAAAGLGSGLAILAMSGTAEHAAIKGATAALVALLVYAFIRAKERFSPLIPD